MIHFNDIWKKKTWLTWKSSKFMDSNLCEAVSTAEPSVLALFPGKYLLLPLNEKVLCAWQETTARRSTDRITKDRTVMLESMMKEMESWLGLEFGDGEKKKRTQSSSLVLLLPTRRRVWWLVLAKESSDSLWHRGGTIRNERKIGWKKAIWFWFLGLAWLDSVHQKIKKKKVILEDLVCLYWRLRNDCVLVWLNFELWTNDERRREREKDWCGMVSVVQSPRVLRNVRQPVLHIINSHALSSNRELLLSFQHIQWAYGRRFARVWWCYPAC